MAEVTICNDFGAPKIKSVTVSIVSPSICHEVMGPENKDHGIWSHHFMANIWGNSGSGERLYFSGLQNHCRCSHEIQKRLLIGRKVMINLDSILKSRDISLSTKVHLVKAMVFPVAMHRCGSWTIKKAERRRINAFELWC